MVSIDKPNALIQPKLLIKRFSIQIFVWVWFSLYILVSTIENYVEYLHKKKAKESSVHRNPYETHDAYAAIRTQDADLAVRK